MAIPVTRALLRLVTADAFLLLPAPALADFTTSLSLNQSAGTTAGSSPAIGIDAKFASTTGGGPQPLTAYLVKPPNPADIGGLGFGSGVTATSTRPATIDAGKAPRCSQPRRCGLRTASTRSRTSLATS